MLGNTLKHNTYFSSTHVGAHLAVTPPTHPSLYNQNWAIVPVVNEKDPFGPTAQHHPHTDTQPPAKKFQDPCLNLDFMGSKDY
jgi:hypothetical protein